MSSILWFLAGVIAGIALCVGAVTLFLWLFVPD
jgi:hypothetical protein